MNKILIMDDEESIRLLIEEELTPEGYEVITSGDCSKLRELIEWNKPDLVVLDIRMGAYNGLELLQEIRNTHFHLPVILWTAYPAYKYDLKSIAADFYVEKSLNFAELKHKIEMALYGSKKRRSITILSDTSVPATIPTETATGLAKSHT